MQLLNNCILVCTLAGEPLVKSLGITEHIGKQEIEESPELVKVVLKRSSRDQETISRVEHSDDLRQRRFLVFDAMSLINLVRQLCMNVDVLTSSMIMYSQANFFRWDFSRKIIS